MSRRTASLAAAALASAVSFVALAPQADAVVVAGTCQGAGLAAVFSPGVTTTPKVITTTVTGGKLTKCTGNSAIPSATATYSGKFTSTAAGQSCTTGTAKGTLTIKWATGQITKLSVTQKPNTATSTPFDLIITGKVTSGPGLAEGATMKTMQTITPTAGNCLLTPLTAGTLAGKVTIFTP